MAEPRILMLTTSYLRFRGDDSLQHSWGKVVARSSPLTVICPSDSPAKSVLREKIDNVNVVRFQYFWPKSLQRLAYGGGGIPANLRRSPLALLQVPFFGISFLISALREAKNADVIDAQFIESGLIGLALKKIFRRPLVTTVHRIVSGNALERFLNRLVLSNSDVVAFNSTYTFGEAKKFLRASGRDWRIINPSLDTNLFAPTKGNGIIRKRFGIAADSRIILSIGKLVEKKGIGTLIRAIPLLKGKKSVLVIGGWGVEEQKLKGIAQELGLLGKRVFFAGKIENRDFPDYANGCNVFVVPSITDSRGEVETFGLAAAEASACGRPVIASRLGGLTDVVEDGKTGFLFGAGNEKELAEKISIVLENPKKEAEFGRNARQRALRNFSVEIEAKKYLEAYDSALKAKPQGIKAKR
ncbi:MAG: glycosyltransferase family 4 protein [archaeon]